MTDNFDKWINGMSDEQYDTWLNDKASDLQEEKALNIREPASAQELADLERQQEGTIPVTPRTPTTDNIVYDTRDLPQKTRQRNFISRLINPQQSDIESRRFEPRQPQTRTEQPQQPIPKPQLTTRQKVANFFRILNFFRRNKVI